MGYFVASSSFSRLSPFEILGARLCCRCFGGGPESRGRSRSRFTRDVSGGFWLRRALISFQAQ